jgi:2-polyprenyl-6-hydroxyphenyl methylase / 3-demethylubiquinone-9 3-methyltransferase
VLIELAQRLPATRIAPSNLHDWQRFIRPTDLRRALLRHGLTPRDTSGLLPRIGPFAALHAIRQCQRRAISYAELGQRLTLAPSSVRAIAYMGWAVKDGGEAQALADRAPTARRGR